MLHLFDKFYDHRNATQITQIKALLIDTLKISKENQATLENIGQSLEKLEFATVDQRELATSFD